MARTTSNGAVVADNGWWYWTGLKWAPLVPKPPESAPGLFSAERRGLAAVVSGRSVSQLATAGKALAALVEPHGSLDAYEDSLGVLVKTYASIEEFQRDAPAMAARGWKPQGEMIQQGKVAVGRTLAKAALTGGIGVALTGRSRKDDKITVTWVR